MILKKVCVMDLLCFFFLLADAAPGQMTLAVATRLDSTELSQNASMYALLQWEKV